MIVLYEPERQIGEKNIIKYLSFLQESIILHDYSYLSNKLRAANKRWVWKKYLINEGSGTNRGPVIFVTLYKDLN